MVGVMTEVTDFAWPTLNYLMGKTGHVTVGVSVVCGGDAMSASGCMVSLMFVGA